MPRPYAPEFRAVAITLVPTGKQEKQTAEQLGIHPVTLSNWLRQDDVDQGQRPGKTTGESAELRDARRRIRELEEDLEIIRQTAKFLGEDRLTQRRYPVIDCLNDAGVLVDHACRVLGPARQNYHKNTSAPRPRRHSCAATGLPG